MESVDEPWENGRRVTQPGSLQAALQWSGAEMALCLREPSGLRGFHIPKQLAATLMRTTERLVVTINALDACRQDGRRTVDVMFSNLQARGGWHICAWLVWPGMLLPPHPLLIVYISFKISLSGVVNDGHMSLRLFSKQYIISDAMMRFL